jgi:outer membrane protein TolC
LSFRYPSLTVGVELRFPLRNRAADAAFATASINVRRTQVQTRAAEQAILVDVRNAWDAIPVRKRAQDAAILSRSLSEEQLAGETARFQAGFSTPFEVLRYQRDLNSARVEELRARVDYELSITALKRATNTLVDEAGVVHIRTP